MLMLLVVLSVGVTSLISGVFGMAGGIILIGIFLELFTATGALINHGIAQLAANGARGVILHKDIKWQVLPLFCGGAVVALMLFSALSYRPSTEWIFFCLGVFPFYQILFPFLPKLDIEKPRDSFLCGLVVGGSQILAGAGIILDVFFQGSKLNRFQIVATKAITQTFGHGVKLVYYVGLLSRDEFSEESILLWIMIIITALLGTYLGGRLLSRLSESGFRAWTQNILYGIGAIFIARACWGWIAE